MKESSAEKRAKDLETIAVLAIAFLLLYFIFHIAVFVMISFVLLVACLLFKKHTSIISNLWLGLSKVIGNFNSKGILVIVYYIVLVPIALLYRIFSQDTLLLKKGRSCDSCFHIRDHSFQKSDFEKMW